MVIQLEDSCANLPWQTDIGTSQRQRMLESAVRNTSASSYIRWSHCLSDWCISSPCAWSKRKCLKSRLHPHSMHFTKSWFCWAHHRMLFQPYSITFLKVVLFLNIIQFVTNRIHTGISQPLEFTRLPTVLGNPTALFWLICFAIGHNVS